MGICTSKNVESNICFQEKMAYFPINIIHKSIDIATLNNEFKNIILFTFEKTINDIQIKISCDIDEKKNKDLLAALKHEVSKNALEKLWKEQSQINIQPSKKLYNVINDYYDERILKIVNIFHTSLKYKNIPHTCHELMIFISRIYFIDYLSKNGFTYWIDLVSDYKLDLVRMNALVNTYNQVEKV